METVHQRKAMCAALHIRLKKKKESEGFAAN